MIFVERKCWILTFKVGYTFLQVTLYIISTCKCMLKVNTAFVKQYSGKPPGGRCFVVLMCTLGLFTGWVRTPSGKIRVGGHLPSIALLLICFTTFNLESFSALATYIGSTMRTQPKIIKIAFLLRLSVQGKLFSNSLLK